MIQERFNKMIDQVSELRNIALERLIQINRITLQYYERQIRPHFFLNCLKNIFGMSTTGDKERIQEYILVLSNYLRFAFQNHRSLIPLKEELQGVDDYIRLQQMTMQNPIQYYEEIESGLEEFHRLIIGKTTVLAGPSGVGKSSITNFIQPEAQMETGGISEKIRRGKHTTRHSELFFVEESTYMMDTPGFSSLYIEDLEPEALKDFFPEFEAYEDECRFLGCVHIGERECGVKTAVQEHKIGQSRYDNYRLMYQELKEKNEIRQKQPLRILYKKLGGKNLIILSPSILGAGFYEAGRAGR